MNDEVQVLEDLTAAIEFVDMLESQQFFLQFSLSHLIQSHYKLALLKSQYKKPKNGPSILS